MSKYSPEQVAAIVKYANQHGRNWKSALNTAWETGIYSTGDNAPILQTLRNSYGPSWLVRLNLKAFQEIYALHQNF